MTKYSFHFQRCDSRRKLNGFRSTRHTALPRHATSDARCVSHVNTAVSPCRHTRGNCWDRQTRRSCDGNLQACVTIDEICGQIPCEANGSSVTRCLWNETVHYRAISSPPLVPVLSQKNPVHISTSCSFKIHFEMTLPSASKLC